MNALKNRGILLTGTTRKTAGQEGGCLIFFRPLMTAGVPLMKSALTPLIIRRNVSSRCSYSKENLWIRNYSINNFK